MEQSPENKSSDESSKHEDKAMNNQSESSESNLETTPNCDVERADVSVTDASLKVESPEDTSADVELLQKSSVEVEPCDNVQGAGNADGNEKEDIDVESTIDAEKQADSEKSLGEELEGAEAKQQVKDEQVIEKIQQTSTPIAETEEIPDDKREEESNEDEEKEETDNEEDKKEEENDEEESEPPTVDDMLAAFKEKNFEQFKKLIDRGADINAEFERRSMLYYAVGMDSPQALDAVKLLLRKGAKIEPADCEYTKVSCPLHYAAFLNKMNIFQYLLEIVGDVNMPDREGCTPVHAAAKGNSMDIIKYLVEERGANMDAQALDRSTPLHMGAVRGHLEVCKYMIERGSDVNFPQNDGTTSLILAACHGTVPVSEYLIKMGADVNKCDNEGWTALHSAACYNYPAVMDVLMAHGANVNALSIDEDNPVQAACQADRPKPIIKLFKNGCDINRPNKRGNSPLFESSSRYHTHSTWALLDCGVDINTQKNIKSFSEAVMSMKLHEKIDLKDVIRMMLEAGAILQAEWLLSLGNAYIVHHCLSLNRLYKHLTNARTLQACCRNVIRTHIRKPISENLDKLDLPAKILHDISLKYYIERNRPSSWRWGGEREMYEKDW